MVHGLVADLFAAAVDLSVPDAVRDVVDVVSRLATTGSCSVTQVARVLRVDASTASRRIKMALAGGYLINDEARPGRPSQLRVGDPLPIETPVLPAVDTLVGVLHGAVQGFSPTNTGTSTTPCRVAADTETGGDAVPEWVTEASEDWVRI